MLDHDATASSIDLFGASVGGPATALRELIAQYGDTDVDLREVDAEWY